MPNDIATWLRFAVQQMASESYLDGINLQDPAAVIRRLVEGNNNGQVIPPDQFTGKTRFVNLLGVTNVSPITGSAQEFASRYQIIDHHANDATGFSGTLLFDRQMNTYTLSMRSTEYPSDVVGGDRSRDVLGADTELSAKGFAFAQLVSMERYFQDLQSSGKLPANALLNITGYSLSGHLATVFTELHSDRIIHTYTFNGAGRGTFSVPGTESQEATKIAAMLADLDARIGAFDPTGSLFQSGATGNIYQDARYVDALASTRSLYPTIGFDETGPGFTGGVPRNEGAFSKITQLFGHAATGFDFEATANAGIHAPATRILIEGQPILEGVDQQDELQYGNTHSITLIVDSLALQELFQTVDPNLQQPQIQGIFKAASDQTADKIALPGGVPLAEGNTLENSLDALRKVFLASVPDTQFGRQPGDFANLTFRNSFYDHIQEIKTALAGQIYRIETLVGDPVNSIFTGAQATDATGLAYRFALKELSPFVVLGTDLSQTQALYARHNETGELALLNPTSGVGELTPQYLTDRAAFLAKKIDVNSNALASPSLTHFKDNQLQEEIGSDTLPLPQFLFGDGNNDTLTGSLFRADHLYGGAGDDHLFGQGGKDYLEGNRGDDMLDGGSGADTMLGGSGNDAYIVDNVGDRAIEYANSGIDTVHSSVTFTLDAEVENLTLMGTAAIDGTGNNLDNVIIGNSGKNTLVGKGGNDRLEGGVGFDTYIYYSGDGTDRIEDTDGQGKIVFDGQLLQGGIHRLTDPTNTYISLDGRHTYTISGTDLVVDGALTINENFQSGQFGIRLIEEASYANGLPMTTFNGTDANDTIATGGEMGTANAVVNAGGGDDYVLAGGNNDQLFGEGGNDTLFGNSANDRLYGGVGNDVLAGDNDDTSVVDGNDLLDGGDGDDQLVGGWGNDLLYGGSGTDTLYGDTTGKAQGGFTADDFLDGGDGNDELHGLAGNDVLYGGTGNDFLSGEEGDDIEDGGTGDDLLLAFTGNDTLSGSAGVDKLYGDQGDDILDGGSENDELYGGDGADTLFGGSGDDLMLGDYWNNPSQASLVGGNDFLDGEDGNDHLEGGIGDDNLFGGIGNDVLFGQEGVDSLVGDDGDDELQGGAGNDLLSGDAGNDRLFGDEGNDTIYGEDGADYLEGDAGDDFLDGGTGNDTYVFNLGDGHDVIADTVFPSEGNLIRFGAGITLANLTLTQDRVQNTLTIQVSGGGDSIQLLGFDLNNVSGSSVVQTLAFANGSQVALGSLLSLPSGLVYGSDANDAIRTGSSDDVIVAGDGHDVANAGDGNDMLLGGAGDDTLNGEAGNDFLQGEVGNDQLNGGPGDDMYAFSIGDGVDIVRDVPNSGETNTLVLASGITSEMVGLRILSGALALRVGNNNDNVIFRNVSLADVAGIHDIDAFQFADGTAFTYAQVLERGIEIYGTSGDDYLTGTDHANRFFGGPGNDTLVGGPGNDTYVFKVGDGMDTIQDSALPGAGNNVLFGAGITPDSLSLSVGPNSPFQSSPLQINVGTDGDRMEIDNFEHNNVYGSHAIDSFAFTDGTVLSYSQLIDRGFDLTGTDNNDFIKGTNVADRLSGLGGNDVLQGGAGNDVLNGGAGNDQLFGGTGDDTYLFDRDSGQDRIVDASGAHDVVQLGAGLTPTDITVSKNGRDLMLSIAGTTDQLTISQFFLSPMLQIEDVQFGDGTVWDAATLVSKARQDINGTGGADVLLGSSDGNVFHGLDGNDRITGLAGDDLLDGGAGADTLIGGIGDDTYVVDSLGDAVIEAPNEGADTVESSITYTLGANVENLTLTGTDPINGTGNELENVLTGNSGANILVGGSGNDTYVVGAGDTVVENAGEGLDTIKTDQTYTLKPNVENLTLTGSAAIDGTGNDLDNMLIGNSSANILSGGKGNDTYIVGAGDTVVELQGEGIDTVETNRSYHLGPNVENLILLDVGARTPETGITEAGSIYGSVAPLRGVGNDLDNVLVGNLDSNVLEGGAGNDTLDGRAGSDVLIGGSGKDTYLFGRGSGTDSIIDTVPGEVDMIKMGPEITPDDVVVGRISFLPADPGHTPLFPSLFVGVIDSKTQSLTEDGLYISASSVDDYLTKEIRFADGTVWDGVTLVAKSAPPMPNPGITVQGGSGDDILVGTSGDDQVIGLAGNDQVDGQDGNDSLYGGEGSDVLIGGPGHDNLNGGATPLDSSGNDTLIGGPGHDFLSGSGGNDDLDGGPGSDTLLGWAANDYLKGGSGDDHLNGGDGQDLLDGGPGNDELSGEGGPDIYLFGRGSGHDHVTAGVLSEDTIQFAPGIRPDDISLRRSVDNIVFRINDTGDDITAALPLDYPQFGIGQVVFSDGTLWDQPFLLATAREIGTPGPDTFVGTSGADSFAGGPGDDTYTVDDPEDTITEVPGEGNDTVFSGVDYTLPENVENLVLSDEFPSSGGDLSLRPIVAVGNKGDNVILGNSADNIIDGGPGNDTLIGGIGVEEDHTLGDGNDILIGGAGDDILKPYGFSVGSVNPDQQFFGADLLFGGPGNDTYVLAAEGEPLSNAQVFEEQNEGFDTVVAAEDYTLGSNVENLLMLGGRQGTGNGLNNVIIGDAEANILDGGAGNDTLMGGFGQANIADPQLFLQNLLDDSVDDGAVDTLIGGAGNDTYILNSSEDIILEQPGEGTDTVQSRVSYTMGDNLENLYLLGSATIGGAGNDLDNVLIGNGAANVLAGAAGNDQLVGGSGNDTYVFNLGDGMDTIQDMATPGEGNRLQFGAGIAQSDLTFIQNQNTLMIAVGAGGEAIQLTNFDPSNRNGSLVVETLAFADGSSVNLANLLVPTGTEGDDVLTTGAGDQIIDAKGGNDIVDTGVGNDTLTGGAGNDTLAGGVGDDTYVFSLGDGVDTIIDTAAPGEGNTLSFGTGITPDSLSLGVGSLLIRVGTAGDVIHLQNFDPSNVYGPHAIDTFRFANGTVLTYSQLIDRGFDLTGTASDDTITGTNGADRMTGLAGNDVIQSGAGNDRLDGGSGSDVMFGGEGNDTYVVDDTNDTVMEAANEGIDSVQSSISYALSPNSENLTLTGNGTINGTGNALANLLTGNSAANLLDGQSGADMMTGGAGDDTYVIDESHDTVVESANEGTDTIRSSVTYALNANVENLTLTGSAAINGTGNALDNVLIGNSGDNVLIGGSGTDRLDGGLGADAMSGGTGDDTYVIDQSGDIVTEALSEGTDTVESAITYTLGANVENLQLLGNMALNGTGNALNNVVAGNAGNNVLAGGAGDDRLDGGLGADTLVGGTGNDTYVIDQTGDVITESLNQGIDTVESSITYGLGANVENLTLMGNAALNGAGNVLNNVLIGNNAANTLDGGTGNDSLDGGDGHDTLLGGSGNDTLSGSNGNDALDGGSGDDVLMGGVGADTVAGGSGNDLLDGGDGNDVLDAGSGNDRLIGGMGNDTLVGGSGNDLYRFDRGLGQDTIGGSDSGTDTAAFGSDINPLDLVLSRQANDLRIAIHGSADQVTIQNWYLGAANQTEVLQAGNGQRLLNSQVQQLIQAMATFSAQSGLTWDQAIAQRPQDVQTILAASWQ